MKQMLYKAEKPQQQWNKVAWFICQSEACKRVVRYNSNNGIPEQTKKKPCWFEHQFTAALTNLKSALILHILHWLKKKIKCFLIVLLFYTEINYL